MVTLRPYQAEGVEAIRDAFASGLRRVCYVLPTGGGKTILFADICQRGAGRGSRILILVHRQELLKQASAKLWAVGVPHGRVSPEYPYDPSLAIQVASVQSLARRLEGFPEPQLIIIDECHHLSHGSSWGKIVDYFSGARLLGVTATPVRLDGKPLGDFFETMILGPSLSKLTEEGYLTPAVYYAPTKIPELLEVPLERGDYARQAIGEIMAKPSITGDAIEHYRRLSPGRPALAFCTSVKHAKETALAFREAGYRAASIDGEMDSSARKGLIADLGDHRIDVLTNCQIITEGTDIAGVHTGIILRPTASLGLHLQILGRMLRLAPGKDRALILDHAGNCLTHGLANEPHEWSLQFGKKPSRKTIGEGIPSVTICPQCYAAQKNPRRCEQCGFEIPPRPRSTKEIEGELRELEATAVQELRRRRAEEQRKARNAGDLAAIAKSRGYKPQWASHILRARKRGRK